MLLRALPQRLIIIQIQVRAIGGATTQHILDFS